MWIKENAKILWAKECSLLSFSPESTVSFRREPQDAFCWLMMLPHRRRKWKWSWLSSEIPATPSGTSQLTVMSLALTALSLRISGGFRMYRMWTEVCEGRILYNFREVTIYTEARLHSALPLASNSLLSPEVNPKNSLCSQQKKNAFI